MPLSEHVHCVAVAFKMTERVEQWICTKFCVQLEHSSVETIQMIQKIRSYDQLVIGSFIKTMHPLMHHIPCRVFWWNVKFPRRLSPLQPKFGTLWLLDFPQTKITFEKEEISDHQWDSVKYNGVADGDWESCMRSQGAYCEGDWGTMFLVSVVSISSSVNVSIFHITWLDTFWRDLVYPSFLIQCQTDWVFYKYWP